jgi:hypothetical protein
MFSKKKPATQSQAATLPPKTVRVNLDAFISADDSLTEERLTKLLTNLRAKFDLPSARTKFVLISKKPINPYVVPEYAKEQNITWDGEHTNASFSPPEGTINCKRISIDLDEYFEKPTNRPFTEEEITKLLTDLRTKFNISPTQEIVLFSEQNLYMYISADYFSAHHVTLMNNHDLLRTSFNDITARAKLPPPTAASSPLAVEFASLTIKSAPSSGIVSFLKSLIDRMRAYISSSSHQDNTPTAPKTPAAAQPQNTTHTSGKPNKTTARAVDKPKPTPVPLQHT